MDFIGICICKILVELEQFRLIIAMLTEWKSILSILSFVHAMFSLLSGFTYFAYLTHSLYFCKAFNINNFLKIFLDFYLK